MGRLWVSSLTQHQHHLCGGSGKEAKPWIHPPPTTTYASAVWAALIRIPNLCTHMGLIRRLTGSDTHSQQLLADSILADVGMSSRPWTFFYFFLYNDWHSMRNGVAFDDSFYFYTWSQSKHDTDCTDLEFVVIANCGYICCDNNYVSIGGV